MFSFVSGVVERFNKYNVDSLKKIEEFILKIHNQEDISATDIHDFFFAALYLIAIPKKQLAIAGVTQATLALRKFILEADKSSRNNFMHFVAVYSLFKYINSETVERIIGWALESDSTHAVPGVFFNVISLISVAGRGRSAPQTAEEQARNNRIKNYIKQLFSQNNRQNVLPLQLALANGDMAFIEWSRQLGFIPKWNREILHTHLIYAIQTQSNEMFNYLLNIAVELSLLNEDLIKELIDMTFNMERYTMLSSVMKAHPLSLNLSPYVFNLTLALPIERCLKIVVELKKEGVESPANKKIEIFNKLVTAVGQATLPTRQTQSFDKIIKAITDHQPSLDDSEIQQKAINRLLAQLKKRFDNRDKYGPGLFSFFGYTREEKVFGMTKLIAILSNPHEIPRFTQKEINCLTQRNSNTGKLLITLFPGITRKNFEESISSLQQPVFGCFV